MILVNRVLSISSSVLILALSTIGVRAQEEISEFAQNVTQHVLYHELGHAVFREFGIPILANEEAMADSFSNYLITQKLRDQAPDILQSRASSWIFEDSEVDPEDYDFKGEHELDIRRAYRTLCFLYGSDPAEFAKYVSIVDFSDRDLADCSDTTPEQIESWDRILQPHMGIENPNKMELIFGDGPMKEAMIKSGLMERFVEVAQTFNWPTPIYVHFDHCDTGASWSRSEKRILLCDDYVARFVRQGEIINGAN